MSIAIATISYIYLQILLNLSLYLFYYLFHISFDMLLLSYSVSILLIRHFPANIYESKCFQKEINLDWQYHRWEKCVVINYT